MAQTVLEILWVRHIVVSCHLVEGCNIAFKPLLLC